MNWEVALGIFLALCSGIGALKIVISSVKNCIKQELKSVNLEIEQIKRDTSKISQLKSKDEIQDMISLAIAQHKEQCPKK